MNPLVVIGAGGFGRETLDVVEAINNAAPVPVWNILGVVDDGPGLDNLVRLEARGIPLLGPLAEWLPRRTETAYVVGVGTPALRRRIADRLALHGCRAATLIHPSAVIGSQCRLGAGAVICAGVQVSTNVAIGQHVHLNPSATIGHDCILEDFVSVNPAATISGDCTVRAGATIGAGAVVLQQIEIGVGATVGAAACVVRDVPKDEVVKGVPAR